MGIGTLLFLMFVFAILSGLGRWATKQRYDRKFEEKMKEMDGCCGGGCCGHENRKEEVENDRNKDTY